MDPRLKRILLPIVVGAAALAILALVVTGGGSRRKPEDAPAAPVASAPAETTPTATGGAATPPATAASPQTPASTTTDGATAAPAPPASVASAAPATLGLVASPTAEPVASPTPLGSLDPALHPYRIDFAPTGAGIDRIVFSDYWRTAADARRAQAHARDASAPAPAEDDRYQLRTLGRLYESKRDIYHDVPLLSMRTLRVDGEEVWLFGATWSEVAPGVFRSVVKDGAGSPVLEVERAYSIEDGPIAGYRLSLLQRARNLTDRPLRVAWQQYGPGDLDQDKDSYLEVRRFHFGYLLPANRDPSQSIVLAEGQMYERKAFVDQIKEGDFEVWPNRASRDDSLSASWFGSTNRYFGLAVFAPYAPPAQPSKLVVGSVERILAQLGSAEGGGGVVFTVLEGPEKVLPPGGEAAWDLGVYAGPLERGILLGEQPFSALNLGGLITYVMNSCCTLCTFAWLANLLVVFLTFLHDHVVFDWALSIILLVLVVRAILHPLTRRAQVQMTRFGKGMSALKPELDALQKRYRDDPRKMQAEQLRLYREKGINPAGCLGGLLPTFLQMPIWIALYAMLFFAFELRQAPAFFGVFQQMGGWTFLGDLSAPDRFIPFPKPLDLWLFTMNGINLLPLLMGLVFWFQQKYMTPPTAATLSDEQRQQQQIMKVMMVIMFPLMLYAAPSGLTLYILTSSCIGIVEGRIIRRRIEVLDAMPKPAEEPRRGGARDRLGRMYADALERARQRQAEKDRAAQQRKFKDRR